MDTIDYKRLAEEQAKANAKLMNKGPSTALPTGPVNLFTQAIDSAKGGMDTLGKAYKEIESQINAGMGTWRDLSKTGISFGNDVVGMAVAAKGTRMDLGEFADTVKNNSVYLAGFGGSINKGAEEFAKTSKVMFDQYGETTDQLRNMGLTNKDLNDALALQAGMIGNSMRSGKERDAIAIESATALATEMDLMAKMTGKSRTEQMESAKKLQADAAFQAKLEQQTRGMSEKEAAEYKTKIMAEYAKSEAIGMGQSFKETFTFGQVMTKAAANEMVMAGKAGTETVKAAAAASAGNFEEASKRNAGAMEAAAANNKNASFQNMVIMGSFSGAAGEAAQKQYMANKALADNIELLKKDPENKGKTDAELIALARQKAKDEQEASSGSTKAVVQVEQRMKDASSAIANGLVGPINKDVSPALTKLADTVLNSRSAFIPGAREKGNIAATEGELLSGRKRFEEGGKAGGSALEVAGYGVAKVGSEFNKAGVAAVDAATSTPSPVKKRAGGSLGMTGSLFENWGSGELVELHGMEAVMRPEDMAKVVQNALGGAKKTLPDLSTAGSQAKSGIDLSKMINDVKTSISTTVSGGGSTTVKNPDIAELTRPFEKSFAQMASGTSTSSLMDAVKASSPSASQDRGISMDSFSLGPNGLPIAKPKSISSAVPEKKKEDTSAEEAVAKAKADAAKSSEPAKEKKAGPTEAATATLDDLLKSLNSLNTKMGQLISTTDEGHSKVAKAAKSGGQNIYNK